MITPPRFVALCGWPKSGKDEAASALLTAHGYMLVDDGLCLRKAVPHLFGCNDADPFSQEGKSKEYETLAGKQTVRWMLGELGRALETHFGADFMPHSAMESANSMRPDGGGNFVFPSIRGSQGKFYKKHQATVIQISRPGVGSSGYDFDRWDSSLVDVIIHNDSGIPAFHRAVSAAILLPASDTVVELRASDFDHPTD